MGRAPSHLRMCAADEMPFVRHLRAGPHRSTHRRGTASSNGIQMVGGNPTLRTCRTVLRGTERDPQNARSPGSGINGKGNPPHPINDGWSIRHLIRTSDHRRNMCSRIDMWSPTLMRLRLRGHSPLFAASWPHRRMSPPDCFRVGRALHDGSVEIWPQ
jgi:hypothetical protein